MSDPTQPDKEATPAEPSRLAAQGVSDDPKATMSTIVLSARQTVPGGVLMTVPGQLGRYQIMAELGRGGMGTVYRAFDTQLKREVALKIPHFGPGDDAALERFYTEARSAARLHHPNICTIFDVNEIDGVHFLTLAFIEGEPLSDRVDEYARRQAPETAALVRTVALALEEAHRQGIVHRDLKPANIMLDARQEPVVMDFGLARQIQGDKSGPARQGALGTPSYMPPEQVLGEVGAMGPGSDVYSLGVVLFELLTGRVPFQGTTVSVMEQHLHSDPPPPSVFRPGLDAHIEAICLKAQAKEPSQRFLSMAEFARALEDYLNGVPLERATECRTSTCPLEKAEAEALVLLRTWGWEVGVEKVRARLIPAEGETDDPAVSLLVHWLEGDEAALAEAPARPGHLRPSPALSGWVLLGLAFLANQSHHFDRVEGLFREAAATGDPHDTALRAGISYQRGFWLYHKGDLDGALTALHEALNVCGRDHFLTGAVLDTLGLVYANRNSFHTACELLERAIRAKERFGEDRAVSRSLRQLGQIYLDWGQTEQALTSFQEGLRLAQRCQDERGQAATFHYLGRGELALGEREAAVGRRSAARRHWERAADWLDASIRSNAAHGRGIQEGHAHRDRALLCLAQGDHEGAEQHVARAESLFDQATNAEGLARAQFVRGILARWQGKHEESERTLRQALAHFDRVADYAEAARTQLEIARTLDAGGAVRQMVADAYLDALHRAETCRRTDLVRAVEEELKAADEEAHWQHVFHRVRGRGATVDTASLVEGVSEVATALFLGLRGFASFCQGLDAGEVMRTVNQMMADLAAVLEQHRAFVTAYLGGGFMALVRGPGHAERAVGAALNMLAVVEAFNRPRAVLGLQQLPADVGIATGSMFVGNIGTYHKMDFTAIGTAVNQASRLMRATIDDAPCCISQETWQQVRNQFTFASDHPREVDLGGVIRPVWDVSGRKAQR
jgi:class 3 adenylate cyclase